MSRLRTERVSDQMMRELSQLIQRELKDPRIPLMTGVSSVRVSNDFSHAECYVNVLGTPRQQEECLEALRNAAGFLRRELTARIRIHTSPDLRFHLDNSIQTGIEMGKKIDEALAADRNQKEASHHDEPDATGNELERP